MKAEKESAELMRYHAASIELDVKNPHWIPGLDLENEPVKPMGETDDPMLTNKMFNVSDETVVMASQQRPCMILFEDPEGLTRNASGVILEWTVAGRLARFILTAAHVLADE